MPRKPTPAVFAQLDIRRLKREGSMPADAAAVEISCGATKVCVSIERTRQALGGERPWFVCPRCERRAAILYGQQAACRRCQRIGYPSQKRTAQRRLMDRCFALRGQAGDPFKPGDAMFMPFPARPAGMHRKRYRRLKQTFNEAEAAYEATLDWRMIRGLHRIVFGSVG